MNATTTAPAPRRDIRLAWLFGLAALATGLVVAAPKLVQGLFQIGLRIVIQLAILAAALGYVSRFWPF